MSGVSQTNQGKLAGDIGNTMGVKIDDHVQFKSNMQILAGKSHNASNVYTVLADGTARQQSEQSYQNVADTQAGFTTNMFQRHRTENIHLDESSHNFSGLHGTNQNSSSGENGLQRAYNTQTNRSGPPPQMFSASLNSADLITSGEKLYENQTKTNNIQTVNQNYAHSIALGNNIHINTSNNVTGQSTTNQYSSRSYHVHAPGHAYSQQPQSSYTQSASSYTQNAGGMQYPSSSAYQSSGNEQLVSIEAQQGSNNTPTYVLLQAPSEGSETGNQPQVFLAMQTGISSQDNQSSPYITLQPVSVDGSEISGGAITQDGIHLQSGALGTATDLSGEGSKQVVCSEGGQQVVLSIPGQQAMLQSGGTSGNNIVTYLQPLTGIGVPGNSMEQNQVIMAASDLQGNLTLLNSLASANKRTVQSSRSNNQVGLQTPRRRLSQDPRTCDQCGRSFKYPSDLKKHLQIHTDIKKFACEECPRTFRRLHQLNVHRRIHTGEKPYACTRCGAQFRHDSTLTMHIRTRHDHLKPFNCEGCGKKFGRMSHLRKHQRNVCGRSSIRGNVSQCKYCDTVFSKKGDLKLHLNDCLKKPVGLDKDLMESVTYICETCGKEFPRLYDFKRHQLIHNEDKPYGCPQCGKTFKERTTLNKHVKRMHCSEGDGTIPIDDVDIIAGDEDEEDINEDGSLSIVGNMTGQTATATVSAETLAKAGIIATADGQLLTTTGQPLTAAELINYPAIAEALGLTSGTHATVLEPDGTSTMITISQPNDLETSEVPMDMEPTVLQDTSTGIASPHYIPASEGLQITPVVHVSPEELDPNHDIQAVYTSNDHSEHTIYSNDSANEDVYRDENALDSSMVFKHDQTSTFIKSEEDTSISDHVKAEEAAEHDLRPENVAADDADRIQSFSNSDLQQNTQSSYNQNESSTHQNIVSTSTSDVHLDVAASSVELDSASSGVELDETEEATKQLVEENSSSAMSLDIDVATNGNVNNAS